MPDPLPGWWPLSPRETQVAQLVASGHTDGEIGSLLGITTKTVSAHVEHIGAKLKGQGAPRDRCGAFLVGVAAYAAAHPGEPLPATLLRDRTVPSADS